MHMTDCTLTPYTMVSSRDWGLTFDPAGAGRVRDALGIDYPILVDRVRNAVYSFVVGCYDEDIGAIRHYYEAPKKRYDEFDSGNFLILLNFLTMFDRYNDVAMLERAERSYDWAYRNCVESQPMLSWQGGVRDGFNRAELYVKYTADAMNSALALHARRPNERYIHDIQQYHNFLKRAREAGFCFTYHRDLHVWKRQGFTWCGFGGPVIAYLQAWHSLGDQRLKTEALRWGEHGLTQQSENGAFYLLDGEFWNSDLTPLELRALVHLFEVTGDDRYLAAANRFASWLSDHQNTDGSWPIGIDRDDEVCAPNIGPGDMPHIALSLIRLDHASPDSRVRETAISAIRYALAQQVIEPGQPYYDDPQARWGFWSWDPRYDFSLSGDQVVHHTRGIVACADYLSSCAST